MSAAVEKLLALAQAPEREAWDHPELSLAEGGLPAAPSFPVEVLGTFWGAWCRGAAKSANAPLDYVALGLLTAAAAVIGNSRSIGVARGHEWREPAILWSVLVGPPSAGKTPALQPVFSRVEALEAEMAAGFPDAQRRHAADLETAKLNREAWETDARRCVKDGFPAPDLPADAVEPDSPIRPRLRITDATVEAVAEIAAGNPRGLLLVRDELSGWWRGFNRYGGDGERAFWLEAWGGRSYVLDRKKNGRPILIPRLSISVLGGVQPDVLSEMLASERDGFAARFLFAYPDAVTGFRLDRAPAQLDRAQPAFARLHSLALVNDGEAPPRPFLCFLSDAAADVFAAWWDRRKTEASSATGLWGDWLSKGGGVVLRFALILEHLRWAIVSSDSSESPVEVSPATLGAALQLFDSWAAPMARRAFGVASLTVEDRWAAMLARWVREKGLDAFNARQARLGGGGPGGPLAKAKHMAAACDRLVEAGLIRPAPKREGETPGRRSSDFEVNIRLFDEQAS